MRYIKVGMIPRTRKKALYEFVKSSAIILAIIIIGAAYDKDHTCALDYFWIYFSIFIFEELCRFAMLVVFNGPMTLNLPLNVPHFAERNGLFVTLILGEAIIASMLADLEGDNGFSMSETLDFSGQPPDVIVLFLLLAAFLMTYMISRLYYDCQPPEEEIIHGEENHAMRMSVKTALLYVYSHVFLFFGLLGLGCGVKITASNLQSEEKRMYFDGKRFPYLSQSDYLFIFTVSLYTVPLFTMNHFLSPTIRCTGCDVAGLLHFRHRDSSVYDPMVSSL